MKNLSKTKFEEINLKSWNLIYKHKGSKFIYFCSLAVSSMYKKICRLDGHRSNECSQKRIRPISYIAAEKLTFLYKF